MTKQRQRERQARRQVEARRAVQRGGNTVSINFTGSDVFVEVDGVRVAKRGHADTEHAGTWISLEPGFVVYSSADHSEITVEYNGVRVQ
jgi:hypothetical protein